VERRREEERRGKPRERKRKRGPWPLQPSKDPWLQFRHSPESQLMGYVGERPSGAKFRAVCWSDAGDVRSWLDALGAQVGELQAAARDRVREKRQRVLSRHEAARQVRAAERAIGQLFEAAKAGFRPSELTEPFEPLPRSPDEPGEPDGEEAPSSERRVMQPPPGSEGA
jgi:hypothetical protein